MVRICFLNLMRRLRFEATPSEDGDSLVINVQVDHRNSCWRCFTIPRARFVLLAALVCLLFYWWLIFNSVQFEFKEGRTTKNQMKEMVHMMDFYPDYAILERSPPKLLDEAEKSTEIESPTKGDDEEEEQIQTNIVSLVSADETAEQLQQLQIVSLASSDDAGDDDHHQQKQLQMSELIAALKGAEDFVGWAGLLSSSNTSSSSLPISATLFIPGNDAISHLPTASTNPAGMMIFDPLLIPYHIVPKCLPFSELSQLDLHTRLPTLLPSKFIIVTNNSLDNFTVNDALVIRPDIFLTSTFAVHGVNRILQYQVFPPSPPSVPAMVEEMPLVDPHESDETSPFLQSDVVAVNTSGSACLCPELSLVLSLLVLGFLISRSV